MIKATDNLDMNTLSEELDNQMSQLNNEINKQMEEIASQVDGKPAKEKRRYIIRLEGEFVSLQSLELPNATKERLEKLRDDRDQSFLSILYQINYLYCDVEDICLGEDYFEEKDRTAFEELAGDQTEQDVRCSQKYLITSSGYSVSLLDGDYNEIDDNLDMNFIQASYLYPLREWEKEAIDDGDEDRLSEINQLKELYKKNGLDEYSDMAFLDENFNFDTDKWYIINMQFCDNTETPREYVLEIDEDFDATKLVAVYADVDLGGNLPDVEILSGLFYDGKPLTLYDEGDDEFLYAKNLIARFSKYKHSNDKGIMVGDGFWVD